MAKKKVTSTPQVPTSWEEASGRTKQSKPKTNSNASRGMIERYMAERETAKKAAKFSKLIKGAKKVFKTVGKVASRVRPGLPVGEYAYKMRNTVEKDNAKVVEKIKVKKEKQALKEKAKKIRSTPLSEPEKYLLMLEKRERWAKTRQATPYEKQKSQNRSHKVKSGDTLSAIAKANNTTVSELAKINGIKDINKIQVGQKLKIKRGTKKSSQSIYS